MSLSIYYANLHSSVSLNNGFTDGNSSKSSSPGSPKTPSGKYALLLAFFCTLLLNADLLLYICFFLFNGKYVTAVMIASVLSYPAIYINSFNEYNNSYLTVQLVL